jgi:phosphate transport system protein
MDVAKRGTKLDRLHTDREYEHELTALRERVLFMGASVEELLTSAMRAFTERDTARAERICELDEQIDRLELEVDGACLHVLARRQPVASDLRFVTTTLKVVTDLERIGDLATNICERVIELGSNAPPAGAETIAQMADIARSMLREALDSFVAGDARRAQQVLERDLEVDQLYAALFPVLIKRMTSQPEVCDNAMRVLSIAKHLERIADHATNVAEMVVFMVEGEDVRHLRSVAQG